MKKKTVFSVVLIVWCVLCTLSVLQIRNVLANHRQNERDDSFDDSFGEDSHDPVLPHLPEFEDNEPVDTMDEETNDEEFYPIKIKPRTPGLSYDDEIGEKFSRSDLLYRYDGYWSMRFGEYFRLDDRNKDVDDNIPIPQEPPAFKDMSELYGRMMETDKE